MKVLQDTKNQEGPQALYIGLDVHKKSWSVSIMSDRMALKSFSQPAEPGILFNYLDKHFAVAHYKCTYESGFSGFCPLLVKARTC